jgi:hypothetical protein
MPLSVLYKHQCVGPHRMKWQVCYFRHLYGQITEWYFKLNPDCYCAHQFHLSLTKFYITHINQNIIKSNEWMKKWMYEPKKGLNKWHLLPDIWSLLWYTRENVEMEVGYLWILVAHVKTKYTGQDTCLIIKQYLKWPKLLVGIFCYSSYICAA